MSPPQPAPRAGAASAPVQRLAAPSARTSTRAGLEAAADRTAAPLDRREDRGEPELRVNPDSDSERKARRWLTPMNGFFAICILAVYLGWKLPTQRFITPVSGIGYALGIVGGSLMLLLLLYPARKRARWLGFLGSVKLWFQAHVVLGIVGPILILYHSNFSLGAANSNVALVCMLLVSGSGIIGRYFYTRIHFELYGRQMTLAEMQDNAARLQQVSSTIAFLPELAQRLEAEEARLLAGFARIPYYLRPFVTGVGALGARWRLRRYIRKAIRNGSEGSRVVRWQRARLGRTARRFVDKRITACRKVAEFEAYERLFSFWHLLHVPLFFMLLVAGIVHVVAVNIY